ncbi:GBA [Branchiostoma lanceolatum]|uniref:Glucosylceramidase n=1 Tax=Branchiostoma lanceolatum TaxID=7740 RepID=A0A8J9ZJ26_BRALA|nr:GBA [Branchiostoma lanceolatum]
MMARSGRVPVLCAVVAVCFVQYVQPDRKPCVVKEFQDGGIVCVCNATYCDTMEPNTKLPKGQAAKYITTPSGKRFEKIVLNFTAKSNDSSDYDLWTVMKNVTYQKIKGFGGAFTDAATINIMSLSEGARNNLISAYFSPTEGIEYTLGRVPMGGCDFSTREYTYDDTPGDLELTKFALAEEDMKYKIPVIKSAMQMSKRKINLFGSPWTAPAWMKTNNDETGKGRLKGKAGDQYHKAWANYFVKFLDEYKKQGVDFWGLTAQNEPTDGEISHFPFQSMGWTAESQRDWISSDLGPALDKAGFSNINLMILDDSRLWLPGWATSVLNNGTMAAKYVDGIAVHWYADQLVPANVLSFTHDDLPDYFVLATEACQGFWPWDDKVLLGNWNRAVEYIKDIYQNMINWVVGWTDWNLALNVTGGPNWAHNEADAAIIVDSKKDEFYKQPMYYAMGHFSKFLPEGSVRVEVKGGPGVDE